jgi:DNA-directed RNA polymerase I subunit RPA2
MTIGMLIESMAGKCASIKGKIQAVEPFENYEDDDVIKYFGKTLASHGY